MKTLLSLALSALCVSELVSAQTSKPNSPSTAPAQSAADKAWQNLSIGFRPPDPPAEWNSTPPSAAQLAAFAKKRGEMAAKVADRAKEFYTTYPDHPKAAEAKQKEKQFRELAGTQQPSAAGAGADADKLHQRMEEVKRTAMGRSAEGTPVVIAQLESGTRDLLKEFPNRAEPYQLLMIVASNSSGEKAHAVAKEILASNAGADVKEVAQALLKKMDMVGKPLDLKFTGIDGRQVEIAKLVGKVVLVDFWATWCGPCVAELPNVKKVYDKFHPTGFEIVGISFDQDKDALQKFVTKEHMAWPQFFDGQGWQNKFGTQFGIQSIPTMWLVDKKGVLRDVNGRQNLAEKVERMLQEF